MSTKKKPFIITADVLRNLGACGFGTNDFNRHHPNGIPLTQENVEKFIVRSVTVTGTGRSGRWLTNALGMYTLSAKVTADDMRSVKHPRKTALKAVADPKIKAARAAMKAAKAEYTAAKRALLAQERELEKGVRQVNTLLAKEKNITLKKTGVTAEMIETRIKRTIDRRKRAQRNYY